MLPHYYQSRISVLLFAKWILRCKPYGSGLWLGLDWTVSLDSGTFQILRCQPLVWDQCSMWVHKASQSDGCKRPAVHVGQARVPAQDLGSPRVKRVCISRVCGCHFEGCRLSGLMRCVGCCLSEALALVDQLGAFIPVKPFFPVYFVFYVGVVESESQFVQFWAVEQHVLSVLFSVTEVTIGIYFVVLMIFR